MIGRSDEERHMNESPRRFAVAILSGVLTLGALATSLPSDAAAQRGVDIPNGRVLSETIAPAPDGSGRTVRLTAEESADGPMLRFRSARGMGAELHATSSDLEYTRARLLQILAAAGTIRDSLAHPEFEDVDTIRTQALIEGLTLEELSVIKRSLDGLSGWEAAIDDLQAMADELSAPGATLLVAPPFDPSIGKAIDGAVPDFDPLATVPAPTFPTPFPANRDYEPTQNEMMTAFPPGYSAVACVSAPTERYTAARFALATVLQITAVLNPTITLLCNLNIDILGFGAKIGCIPAAVFAGVVGVINLAQSLLSLCADLVNAAEIQAGYENGRRIMARLNSHNADMLTRFQRNQVFLQDFEGNIARQAMELNMASAQDDPIGLFVLPRTTCRDLQGPVNDSYFAGNVGQRDQCGLIEEIDRVVDELRAMVAESGLTTNNADAEIAAAKAHLAVGEYKSAYARYRKAFRELASTHTVP